MSSTAADTDAKGLFHKDILKIQDVEAACDKIAESIRYNVLKVLGRRGGVVGISGGIDSSVTLALAVKALGSSRVLGIMLPEKDSSPDSRALAQELADAFGVQTVVEDITDALSGFGCYKRRDEAVRRVFPDFDPERHKFKIGISKNSLETNMPPVFTGTIIKENGALVDRFLPLREYLQIVASSNFKQRSRMSMLYYHAERMHYAVVGTPNKHEVEQGFFVKYGDGGADLMPIGNYYKTQVYQFARHLGVPAKIINRTPTTDTYTAEQTQEEFFFQLPFELMDLIWYGWENGHDASEVAAVLDYEVSEIENVYKNFARKKKTTEYLRRSPIF
jgi:NAD+ synthase